jgi:hypothetical protein
MDIFAPSRLLYRRPAETSIRMTSGTDSKLPDEVEHGPPLAAGKRQPPDHKHQQDQEDKHGMEPIVPPKLVHRCVT